MKKTSLPVALCLIALMLFGCGREQPVTEPPTTVPATVPTTAPTQPTTLPTDPTTEPPVTETTAPTEPAPPTLEPVTLLECTRWLTFPQLLSLGEGQVATSMNGFDKASECYVNQLQILDVYTDTILHTLALQGTRELVPQQFPDGCFVTADAARLEYTVYDRTLTEQQRFTAPSVEGVFSQDRETLYYLESGVLYRMDTATGNRGRVALSRDLRFESLAGAHPDRDILVAHPSLSHYTDHEGLAVIDLTDGTVRMFTDRLSHVWLTEDRFYGIGIDETTYGNDVFSGSLTGGPVTRLDSHLIGDDQMGWSMLTGSHLLQRRFAPDEGERDTALFDLKNGTRADLKDYGFIDCAFGSVWLPDEQLILGFYEEGDYFYPVLMDPKAMTFTEGPATTADDWTALVDGDLLSRWEQTVAGPTLAPALDAVRRTADRLEQTYGITVRLAEQTTLPCRYAGQTAEALTDPAAISAALTTLEQELAKYPADFFTPFRNSAGEGGLCISLTGKLTGDLSPTGFCRLIRDRIEIGVDGTSLGLPQTIHHEIWHAIETRLSSDTFDIPQWSACNPKGHTYYDQYDMGYNALTRWTWTHGGSDPIHFVDPYARINAGEDRAKLWEMVMTIDTTALRSSAPIAQKLAIMEQTMQTTFPAVSLP